MRMRHIQMRKVEKIYVYTEYDREKTKIEQNF